jgi:diaminopimelate epimerase
MTSLAGSVVYKMTGSGNDFVFVDGRTSPPGFWTSERIQEVCSRHRGVGADGFVILDVGTGPGAVRLQYFNQDGARAALCGNASLCAVRLARWIELGSVDELVLETDAGPVRSRCLPGPGERAEIVLGPLAGVSTPPIPLESGEQWMRFVQVGVPHLVVMVDSLSAVPVLARGRGLRHHAALGDAGANVNFVSSSEGHWAVRTYERGVEAETLACGTGAVAVAAVLAATDLVELPVDLRTASGCTLTVGGSKAGRGSFADMRLVGQGRLVFRAVLGS